jgi:hypothetical protein
MENYLWRRTDHSFRPPSSHRQLPSPPSSLRNIPLLYRCICCIRCGAQFTSKMEGMLNDLSIGADTSRAFSEFVRTHGEAKASLGKMEFSVQVNATHNSLSHLLQCNAPHHTSPYSTITEFLSLHSLALSLSLSLNLPCSGVDDRQLADIQSDGPEPAPCHAAVRTVLPAVLQHGGTLRSVLFCRWLRAFHVRIVLLH